MIHVCVRSQNFICAWNCLYISMCQRVVVMSVCVCGVSFLNGKCLQHVGLDGCMQCVGVF